MRFSPQDYPNLHAGNYRVTRGKSRKARRYNCIAWAAGIERQWWEPQPKKPVRGRVYYWPPTAPSDYKVTSLVFALESVGFKTHADGTLEDGVEKIVIYADGPEWMHAARQLDTGKWTSKMGAHERIEHDAPEDLVGPAFGQIAAYMQRKR